MAALPCASGSQRFREAVSHVKRQVEHCTPPGPFVWLLAEPLMCAHSSRRTTWTMETRCRLSGTIQCRRCVLQGASAYWHRASLPSNESNPHNSHKHHDYKQSIGLPLTTHVRLPGTNQQARLLASPSRTSITAPRAPGAKALHDNAKCAVGHAGTRFWEELKARKEAVPVYDEVMMTS